MNITKEFFYTFCFQDRQVQLHALFSFPKEIKFYIAISQASLPLFENKCQIPLQRIISAAGDQVLLLTRSSSTKTYRNSLIKPRLRIEHA